MLAKIVGLPTIEPQKTPNLTESELSSLLEIALKNKIPVLFIEKALQQYPESKVLKSAYQAYSKKVTAAKNLVRYVNIVLDKANINYAIFKTIKPFPSFGADVDVILFSRDEFYSAWRALTFKGCRLEGYGAFSASLLDVASEMNVDLHLQIAVSQLVYMDVRQLKDHVVRREFNGLSVPVLDSHASIITDTTHALFKEQLLTYSDIYLIVSALQGVDSRQMQSTLDLITKTHSALAAKTAVTLINHLTKQAFNKTIPEVVQLDNLICLNSVEQKVMNFLKAQFEHEFNLPYNYHIFGVAAAFISKMCQDPVMRASSAHQFWETITNTPYLWKNVRLHMKGEAE
jgi:hypothetical protein